MQPDRLNNPDRAPPRRPLLLNALDQAGWVWAGAAFIALATVFAYLPAIKGGFIWDDDSYVTANTLLRDANGLRLVWIPGQTPQYYPAVFTSFWIEYQIWRLNPMGYHIVNVILHALNALLVWRLCAVLRLPGGLLAGWLAAAIFALHPVHVESVAWITERKNVLSGLFYLAAALAYLKFDSLRETDDAQSLQSRKKDSWGWYGLTLVLFVLALLSKSVTCSLPAALVLMMLWQRGRITLVRIVPLGPMFVIGLLLALQAQIERTQVGAEGDDFMFSWVDRVLIASNAMMFYPLKIIWPMPVMFVYPRWTIDPGRVALWAAVAGVVASATGSIILYRRGWRGPALALAFYAGTIFPALGFVNIYPMRFSFVADHFQYLASLGIIVLLISGLAHLVRGPLALAALGLATLPILFGLSWRQAGTYLNAETVFRDTLDENERAWMPHNNLGNILLERDAVEAELHFRAALDIKPEYFAARSNLAEALRLQERYQESIEHTEQSIREIRARMTIPNARPPKFLAHEYHRLGRAHAGLGNRAEAEAAFEQALTIDADFPSFHQSFAHFLMQENRADEAAEHFEAAAELDSADWASMRALAVIREKQARYAEAIEWAERAMAAAPSADEQIQVVPTLIRLLATCPDPAKRQPARAIQLAEQLCAATGWFDPGALDVLASVYAAAGRINDAVRTAEQAIELARRAGMEEVVNMIGGRLATYRQQLQAPANER